MDVGQGEGALLISPQGETVLFDSGVRNDCDRPLSYLQQLGISKIDYLIASHYHDDHIGCVVALLQEFPLQKTAFDRGDRYSTRTFTNYVEFLGSKRKTVIEDSTIKLDAQAKMPVLIQFVALNGNGISTRDENDRSVVTVIHFGQFDAVLGGDLSGFSTSKYRDIESSAASKVGQVEVYEVNHHGSQYSSNPTWLDIVHPQVGIISCGDTNEYYHPTKGALDRLHSLNIHTYWTEVGNGVKPSSLDKVGGNIIVEVATNTTTFEVKYAWTNSDSYPVWNPVSLSGSSHFLYGWSTNASIYHLANCKYLKNVAPQNLERGDTPPPNKTLHLQCPK